MLCVCVHAVAAGVVEQAIVVCGSDTSRGPA
jgi:hypothetical protein